MQAVIVGPGALGCLLAARLGLAAARAGRVLPWLLDHRVKRVALLAGGILLEEGGVRRCAPVRITADSHEIAGAGRAELILLCVKSMAVGAALDSIAPLLASSPLVVALQNGIGHLEVLRQHPAAIAVGITSEGATLVGPGQVCHAGQGETRMGFLDPVDADAWARLEAAAAQLNQAGLRARTSHAMEKHLWAKLFVNVGINALSAIHGRPNGQLLTSCSMRNQIKAAVGEAMEVARKLHIPIDHDPIEATFAVCRATRRNISSMLQDVRGQRPTEILAINGAIVATGRRLGIPTPVNEHLVARIQAIEVLHAANVAARP